MVAKGTGAKPKPKPKRKTTAKRKQKAPNRLTDKAQSERFI